MPRHRRYEPLTLLCYFVKNGVIMRVVAAGLCGLHGGAWTSSGLLSADPWIHLAGRSS